MVFFNFSMLVNESRQGRAAVPGLFMAVERLTPLVGGLSLDFRA